MKYYLPFLFFLVCHPVFSVDMAVCTACHNADHEYNPTLNGQHPKYTEKQLKDLKKDLRIHAQMQSIAKTLDDNQIKEISDAFAKKEWENYVHKSNPKTIDKGKRLVQKGNCTRCHGSELEGTYNIPRIAGQKYQYLKTTLLQYKNKERKNFPPMSSMLNRYTPEEIDIMADYISGLKYQ